MFIDNNESYRVRNSTHKAIRGYSTTWHSFSQMFLGRPAISTLLTNSHKLPLPVSYINLIAPMLNLKKLWDKRGVGGGGG